MLQTLAWIVSLLLITAIAGVFIHIIAQSHLPDDNHTAAAKSASWRGRIFWALALLFVPIIAFSLTRMPYGAAEASSAPIVVGPKAISGASMFLLFTVPHSPMTQPWPLVGGYWVVGSCR